MGYVIAFIIVFGIPWLISKAKKEKELEDRYKNM